MAIKNIIDQIIIQFRNNILNGDIPFGAILPTEEELAKKFNISRPTIAKVYNSLQNEGLVKKKIGFGTTVVFNKDKKKYIFGLLLPGSGESEIFSEISDHILELSKQKDITCLWEGTIANNAEMRQDLIMKNIQHYIDNKVDLVIFSPLERTSRSNFLNEKICKMLDEESIPLILIDRDIFPFPKRSKYDIIGIDNFRAGYLMTDHLIKSGCENIYFFYRKDSAFSVNLRLLGCRTACFDSGINFNPDNAICGEPSDIQLVKKIKIFNKKTGVLCANDSTAAMLMTTINRIGFKISKDLLIAGFDDMKYAKNLQIPLTTYRQPLCEIAMCCFNVGLNKLLNPQMAACTYNFEGKIIICESSKFT